MQLENLHTTAYINCLKLPTQTRQHLLQVRQTSEKVWKQMDFSQQATFQPIQTLRKLLCDSILLFQSAFTRFQG